MPINLNRQAALDAVRELCPADDDRSEIMVDSSKSYATPTTNGYATWLSAGIEVIYHPGTKTWDVGTFDPGIWRA